jgi:hypothetical protein
MLESGEFATIAELAEREGPTLSFESRVFRLTLLALELAENILDGRLTSKPTLARVRTRSPVIART